MTTLRWRRINAEWPPELAHLDPIEAVGAKRYHHHYVIVHGEEGFTASYKAHLPGPQPSRFINDSRDNPFATQAEAAVACEADLRGLLGRRH